MRGRMGFQPVQSRRWGNQSTSVANLITGSPTDRRIIAEIVDRLEAYPTAFYPTTVGKFLSSSAVANGRFDFGLGKRPDRPILGVRNASLGRRRMHGDHAGYGCGHEYDG